MDNNGDDDWDKYPGHKLIEIIGTLPERRPLTALCTAFASCVTGILASVGDIEPEDGVYLLGSVIASLITVYLLNTKYTLKEHPVNFMPDIIYEGHTTMLDAPLWKNAAVLCAPFLLGAIAAHAITIPPQEGTTSPTHQENSVTTVPDSPKVPYRT